MPATSAFRGFAAKGPTLFEQVRIRLREEAESLSAGPSVQDAETMRCASDPIYWIDRFCQTYDPRTDKKTLPFHLFPKQKEFIAWLQERERLQQSGLCEKSRGVGVSFLCAAYALHGWLYKPGCKVGFGSRKLEYVDKLGDLDSVFEKIRFMLYRLPEGMRPVGFREKIHDCYTKLLNPETGAAITGEGGDDVGRGGRTSLYFCDESAFWEHPQLAERSLIENTNVRIDVSTPNGPGNPFATKRFSGSISVFSFHWHDDPRKNEEWAERTKREKGLTAFAAEYDIDYSASIEGICIPGAWVRAAVRGTGSGSSVSSLPGASANGSSAPAGKCVAGLDIGEEGADLSVLIPRWGPYVGDPISWGKLNTTQTAWRARDECHRLGVAELNYDSVGIGAGVKGTLNMSDKPLRFAAKAINVGESPSESMWPDQQTSKEKFANLKAELWWKLRQRFERTYEHVVQGIVHLPEDLISIPHHPQLIADLSLPLHEQTETGKIRIEAKASLRRRGIKSPDFAEALVLSEASYALKKLVFWMR